MTLQELFSELARAHLKGAPTDSHMLISPHVGGDCFDRDVGMVTTISAIDYDGTPLRDKAIIVIDNRPRLPFMSMWKGLYS